MSDIIWREPAVPPAVPPRKPRTQASKDSWISTGSFDVNGEWLQHKPRLHNAEHPMGIPTAEVPL